MKKIAILLTFLLICNVSWGVPTDTATRPNSYTTGAVVDADEQNSNENTIYNAYNAHTHEDLTKTSSTTWTIGTNTDVDHRFIADNGDASNPELRYDSGDSAWQFSNDGSTFTAIGAGGGVRGGMTGFELTCQENSGNIVAIGAGSVIISGSAFNTTGTTNNISVASDKFWIGGSATDTASTSIYLYAFDDGSGNNVASFRYSTVAPNAIDESNNTGGTNIFYTTGGTTYRYIGYILNNSNSDIASFSMTKDTVMWHRPGLVTTTVSDNTWSSALDCSTFISPTSRMGIFGLRADDDSAESHLSIRPNGSAWKSDLVNGIALKTASNDKHIAGQRMCATDVSQQIQYFSNNGDDATEITVEGYIDGGR